MLMVCGGGCVVNCSRSLLGLFVGACFLGGEGVLDRGFLEVYLVGCRGDVGGWLDVWVVLSWQQEGHKPPCCLDD